MSEVRSAEASAGEYTPQGFLYDRGTLMAHSVRSSLLSAVHKSLVPILGDRSVDKGDPRPFSLVGAGQSPTDRRAVLLIHGFGGTPFEMRYLGEYLAKEGLSCEAPLLAGHGEGNKALAKSHWHKWVATAEAALLDLHERVQNQSQARPSLGIVGFSMGGLITLELCRRHPKLIDAISVIASPLTLTPISHALLTRLGQSRLRPLVSKVTLPKFFGSDARDPTMRHKSPSAPGMPLAAVFSLGELMAHVRKGLPEVDKPALLAYAKHDHTVPYACMDELVRRLGTKPEALSALCLPRSYHQVTLDVDREQLFWAVAGHLRFYLD